jgi:hypothetical protein
MAREGANLTEADPCLLAADDRFGDRGVPERMAPHADADALAEALDDAQYGTRMKSA